MGIQIFHYAKIYLIFKKKSSQNPSRYYYYYNSIITNLKFQHNLAKIVIFQKSSYKNEPIIIIT
jgi:hypothetical protein